MHRAICDDEKDVIAFPGTSWACSRGRAPATVFDQTPRSHVCTSAVPQGTS